MRYENITVSLEDEIYREARIVAAEADSSVTALIREFLVVLTKGKKPEGKAQDAILATIDRLRLSHQNFDPEGRLSRETVHQRAL